MSEERRGFRFLLNASAEIAAESSPNATVRVRATELSLNGCYLESPAPFAEKTAVLVKIFHADEYFEAKGTVIYVKPAIGMGLTFREVNPYCLAILQKWILAALHERTKTKEHPE
jgi:PilZ domain-containing protein